jgi:photosystem II stability/assembly factor-like uncharacterized protein
MTGWLSSSSAGVIGAQGVGGVILSTDTGGKNWELRLETKDANYFTSASFWDDRRGCIVGSSNFLFCTTDGGRSWLGHDVLPHYRGPCPSDVNLFTQLVMLQSGKGWVRDNGGLLYKTDDAGATWREIDPSIELHTH